MARKTSKKSTTAKGTAGAKASTAGKGKTAPKITKAGVKASAQKPNAGKSSGKSTGVKSNGLKSKAGKSPLAARSGTKGAAKSSAPPSGKRVPKVATTSSRSAAKQAAPRPQAKSGAIDATRRRASAAAPVMARKPVAPRAKTAGGARPHSPSSRTATKRAASAIFAEAVERAMQGYLFDAVSLFRDVVESEPSGALADDALFNIGTALLQMRMVTDAEKTFTELIEKYPESTIDAVYNGNEHGRTAAKALLGRMQARLAQGKFDEARADREALAGYEDSWVTDPNGNRKSFRELAVAVMP